MATTHDSMAQRARGVPKRAIVSYIFDYVVIIALFIAFALINKAEPFHQPFSLKNIYIQYPMAKPERVSTVLLIVVSVAIPAGIIVVFALIIDPFISMMDYRQYKRGTGNYGVLDRLWELNCGILGLALSEGAAFVITQALKNLIGKPRPDFISRCQPIPGITDPEPYGLNGAEICTQTDASILKDGYRSFPSGHSSTAWAGLYYLSLYLAGKLHVLDHRGEVWRALFVLVPALSAALIAGTRIIDARHHGFDVIVGSLIGLLVAWGSYRQYFYPVTDSSKRGRAFPARTWGRNIGDSGADGPHTNHVMAGSVTTTGSEVPLRPMNRNRLQANHSGSSWRADEEHSAPDGYARLGAKPSADYGRQDLVPPAQQQSFRAPTPPQQRQPQFHYQAPPGAPSQTQQQV